MVQFVVLSSDLSRFMETRISGIPTWVGIPGVTAQALQISRKFESVYCGCDQKRLRIPTDLLQEVAGIRNGEHASPPPPCERMAPATRALPCSLIMLLSLLSSFAEDLRSGAARVAEGHQMKRNRRLPDRTGCSLHDCGADLSAPSAHSSGLFRRQFFCCCWLPCGPLPPVSSLSRPSSLRAAALAPTGVYKPLLVIDPEVCKRGARLEDRRVRLAPVGRFLGLLVAAGGKTIGESRSFGHATTTPLRRTDRPLQMCRPEHRARSSRNARSALSQCMMSVALAASSLCIANALGLTNPSCRPLGLVCCA